MFEWTDEKISTIKELWGKKSATIIGQRIGTTKNAVLGKARRLHLPKIGPSPYDKDNTPSIKIKVLPPPIKRKPQIKRLPVVVKEPIMVRQVKRGRCQWIEGDPEPRQTSDEGKCLRPTVYRDNGERSPYCLEHTQRAWRQAKLKDIGDVS